MPVRFIGDAVFAGDVAILRPSADTRVELRLRRADVRLTSSGVEVTEGSTVLGIDLPSDPTLPRAAVPMPQCQGSSSACIGGVLICCDSGTVVDACNGTWYCPP